MIGSIQTQPSELARAAARRSPAHWSGRRSRGEDRRPGDCGRRGDGRARDRRARGRGRHAIAASRHRRSTEKPSCAATTTASRNATACGAKRRCERSAEHRRSQSLRAASRSAKAARSPTFPVARSCNARTACATARKGIRVGEQRQAPRRDPPYGSPSANSALSSLNTSPAATSGAHHQRRVSTMTSRVRPRVPVVHGPSRDSDGRGERERADRGARSQ